MLFFQDKDNKIILRVLEKLRINNYYTEPMNDL